MNILTEKNTDNFKGTDTKPNHCFSHLPAKKHHHRISFGWDEAQEEYVATSTVVALQHSFTERSIFVQCHLFAFGPHHVVHNVAGSQILTMIQLIK